MKTIVKTRFFKPIYVENNGIGILVYELIDEKWSESSIKSQRNLLDKLLVIAQNNLSIIESSGELIDKYVYVEVEYPGLKASRGDGRVQGTEVIVFPLLQPLKSIVFLKKEGNELKDIYRIFFKQEKWIYDSIIRVDNIDFNAVLVESIENKRIILSEELISPRIFITREVEEKNVKKKKRRKTRKKSRRKASKSKGKSRRKTKRKQT